MLLSNSLIICKHKINNRCFSLKIALKNFITCCLLSKNSKYHKMQKHLWKSILSWIILNKKKLILIKLLLVIYNKGL